MTDLYLDHVLIAVRDLARAAGTFADGLGFTLTPEGVHPGRGTHNRLIVFGPDYLELIAIRDPAEAVFRPSMVSFLKSREGLYMFALGTRDVDATVARLRARGAPVQDPAAGARQGSGRSPGYTWKFAGVAREATPGSETFLIQHDNTIEERYPEPPNATHHPNGATGVHHLSLVVLDAEAAASRWQEAFGLEASPLEELPEQGFQRVRVKLEGCYLDFVTPMRTGAMTRFLDRHGEGLYLLCLRVKDLAATSAALAQRGIPVRRQAADADGVSIVVDPAHAHGVTLQFLQPA